MKNSTKRAIVAVAAVLIGSIQAFAATLSGVTGQVFINKGQGFKAAENGATVNPGDVVMAREGASANVVFPDGTSLAVEAGKSVSVGTTAGVVGGGLTTGTLIAGAGLVGGVIAGAVVLSNQDSKSSPASP